VNDKWDVKEPDKSHKLVDYAGRCVHIPDDPAAQKSADDCVGKYEYMPDESWKGSGSCTLNFKDKSSITGTWEEGSHLKEYTWTVTDGTGKYKGAKGGSAYMYDNLTDTLSGGKYRGTIELPWSKQSVVFGLNLVGGPQQGLVKAKGAWGLRMERCVKGVVAVYRNAIVFAKIPGMVMDQGHPKSDDQLIIYLARRSPGG
jgi:hypothetical protein